MRPSCTAGGWPSCAAGEPQAAPTAARPRPARLCVGHAGGWLAAGRRQQKWVKVRNEKRKLEGAVKMAAWQELLAGKRAAREAEKEARVQQKLAQAAAKEQERLLKERNRQELERNRQEFEQELKKRRAAEQQAAREAVKLDGKTVYCTWHLSRCDVDGSAHGRGPRVHSDISQKWRPLGLSIEVSILKWFVPMSRTKFKCDRTKFKLWCPTKTLISSTNMKL